MSNLGVPVAKGSRITAWSYSRLKTWEECGYKAYLKFIAKLKEPGSPAMDRGDMMHKNIEAYCKGTAKLHVDNKGAKHVIDRMKKSVAAGKARLEYEIAFDKRWNLVSWFAPDAWVRYKADAMEMTDGVTEVTDWKSGKLKEHGEYDEQVQGYEGSALIAGFGKQARGRLVFLDHGGKIGVVGGDDEHVMTLADVPKFKKEWTARTAPMLNDRRFDPRAQYSCKWCHFRKSNAGPCIY